MLSYRPEAIALAVDADRPGYLLFWDGYDPEWTADIDGKPVEVLRANLGSKAIVLPRGRSEIRFRYRPWGWFACLAIYFTALGADLRDPFTADPLVERLAEDADRFKLGFKVEERDRVSVPAYTGTSKVRFARAG